MKRKLGLLSCLLALICCLTACVNPLAPPGKEIQVAEEYIQEDYLPEEDYEDPYYYEEDDYSNASGDYFEAEDLSTLPDYTYEDEDEITEEDSGFSLFSEDGSVSLELQKALVESSRVPGDFDYSTIPVFTDQPYVVVNNNIPYFDFEDKEFALQSFENYGELDALDRCGIAAASVGVDLMPTEERGSIGSVKPSGWQTIKYDCVDGKYLYNRCHLIGYQLTAENANPNNLITGTRYLNIQGMLPFENLIADYVKETSNHVLYRVTPVFVDQELVARGVLMEGVSVEDGGEGVEFCVFAYNNQPGIEIDYATGGSKEIGTDENFFVAEVNETSDDIETGTDVYVLNTLSGKFHLSSCSSLSKANPENLEELEGTRDEFIEYGFSPCGVCKP